MCFALERVLRGWVHGENGYFKKICLWYTTITITQKAETLQHDHGVCIFQDSAFCVIKAG